MSESSKRVQTMEMIVNLAEGMATTARHLIKQEEKIKVLEEEAKNRERHVRLLGEGLFDLKDRVEKMEWAAAKEFARRSFGSEHFEEEWEAVLKEASELDGIDYKAEFDN